MSAKYGQHFLSNRHAADRIVAALEAAPGQDVVEIGPGKGALTSLLVERGLCVTAIEVDPVLVARLRSRFGSRPNFGVVEGDILAFDWSSLPPGSPRPIRVIGNLPYNLTSPILRRLSEWADWDIAIVMVQKEVGDRLCANVGTAEYGALTVGMSLACEMERVFDLSPASFDPPPKIRSTVVRLKRRATPLTTRVAETQRVIQAAFQQRRKTLLNALSHGLDRSKGDIRAVLGALGIAETTRGERLVPDQFVRLADRLF